jgi:hypothetical protein
MTTRLLDALAVGETTTDTFGYAVSPGSTRPRSTTTRRRPTWASLLANDTDPDTSNVGASVQREAGRGAREARRLAQEGTARAVRRLIELVDSTDERVAAIAAQAVLGCAFDSARRAAGADDAAGQVNISQVDP